jgi:hypothetical protein
VYLYRSWRVSVCGGVWRRRGRQGGSGASGPAPGGGAGRARAAPPHHVHEENTWPIGHVEKLGSPVGAAVGGNKSVDAEGVDKRRTHMGTGVTSYMETSVNQLP